MLMRSCSPSEAWWDPAVERPSSQLFKPTPKDEGKLSVADGSKTTPEGFSTSLPKLWGCNRGVFGELPRKRLPL